MSAENRHITRQSPSPQRTGPGTLWVAGREVRARRRIPMLRNAARDRRPCVATSAARSAKPLVLLLALMFSLFAVVPSSAARQADSGFSPASGPAQVIAQGVVPLPEGDAVWRTVRTRAPLPQDAPFEARPLGFVLASSGPLLLADQESGEQVRLGT